MLQTALALFRWQFKVAIGQPNDREVEALTETTTVVDEKVLCVPARTVRMAYPTPGFTAISGYRSMIALDFLFNSSFATFLPRSEVETDFAWLQTVPYVVLRSGDKVFSYPRGKGSGEARLHARLSIGLGGHIDEAKDHQPGDVTPRHAFNRGLIRELDEEISYSHAGCKLEFVGLLRDESNDVGRVHLGLV